MLQKSKINELKDLLKIPSNSNNHQALHRAGVLVQKLLRAVPISWERIQAKNAADFFIGRSQKMDPTQPIVILSGHLDVVPPVKNPKVVGNYMHAAGALDMKGGIYAMVEVVRNLHKQGMLKNIILTLNTQEEIGNPQHGKTIMKLAKEGDYVMVFEGGEKTVSNEWRIIKTRKGARIYKIQITKKRNTNSTILHSALINLVQNINSAVNYSTGTTANVGIIKQYSTKDNCDHNTETHIQLTLSGPGGHSGNRQNPNERHNTINILVNTLRDITEKKHLRTKIVGLTGGNKVNAIPAIAKAILCVSGNQQSILDNISNILKNNNQKHQDQVTHNISKISSPKGSKISGYNIVGEYRFRTKAEDKRMRNVVRSNVKEIEKKGLIVKIDDDTRFPNLEQNTQTATLMKLVQGIAKTQGIALVFQDKAGSSDANHFSGGNPKIAILDCFGPRGSDEHTKREKMDLRTLETSIKFSQEVIKKLIKNK